MDGPRASEGILRLEDDPMLARYMSEEGAAAYSRKYERSVLRRFSNRRELALVRWGLIPGWSKDPARLSLLINARAEGAAEKASFRGAMRHRRCLVPANGFYEWTGKAGARLPHLIRRPDSGLMAFAGLWESWLGADGSEIDTIPILTVAASPTLPHMPAKNTAIIIPSCAEAQNDPPIHTFIQQIHQTQFSQSTEAHAYHT